MKWKFINTYRSNINLNVGPITQVVGQNQEIKHFLWQIMSWYFGGKKYTETDLSLFNQEEPLILCEGEMVKRQSFKLVEITELSDIIEHMIYKKGTIAFEYIKSQMEQVSVRSCVDEIGNKLDEISCLLNHHINLSVYGVYYQTESIYLTVEQILSKNFLPQFVWNEKNIAFEFVNNKTKLFFLIEMLDYLMLNDTQPILIVLKNMDDYLDYESFYEIMTRLNQLTSEYPYCKIIVFPSNEGYLFTNEELIPYINIFSEQSEHLCEFTFFYERFCQCYPSTTIISEGQFLDLIRKNAAYLFSESIRFFSLSISDLVFLKIVNELFFYDKKIDYSIPDISLLELNFINEKSDN